MIGTLPWLVATILGSWDPTTVIEITAWGGTPVIVDNNTPRDFIHVLPIDYLYFKLPEES